ncbi:hypothetical protein SARC_08484 [Sphaeroforma arctica JP610]|uniref:Uncharacterized protein n=1 Tax=Sphaeroforma arctica JP610 TaxID=667725 RepID=A0A0L0FQQ6_9EUKA|nr:hypothetical protein SARC_08484 [Sphaeroforma arctica JP610]KNC79117.1 hypothetical protein SARC_08484 [Sphaeroforma arctica JP610]|eukprot:XP_014153019.1 hypothetical protein SARC_08484 [Sphaeroforma arctica JP610]
MSREEDAKIQNILQHPDGHMLAVQLLRQKLLDIGYLSYLALPEEGHSDWATAAVTLLVPVRQQHTMGVKGRMNMRKKYAEKQKRDLEPTELAEIEKFEKIIKNTMSSSTGLVNHEGDSEWFLRDMAMIAQWLVPQRKGDMPLKNVTMEAERDDYFKAHIHFAGSAVTLKNLLPPGGFPSVLLAAAVHLH